MNTFFPNIINEWNELDTKISNSSSPLKNSLLSFIQPLHCDTSWIHNPVRLKLLTRLWMGVSYLNEHKFKHNFNDFLNFICAHNLEAETTRHFLLCCNLFQTKQRTPLNVIKEIPEHIASLITRMISIKSFLGKDTKDMIRTEWFYYLLLSLLWIIKGLICIYFVVYVR